MHGLADFLAFSCQWHDLSPILEIVEQAHQPIRQLVPSE
jgi:hypothetical protein